MITGLPDFKKTMLIGAAALALGTGLAACGAGGDGARAGEAAPTSADAASISAPSPFDETFRIKKAEEIDLDRLFALFPEAARPTYDAVSFDKKIGATVATGLKVSKIPAGDTEDFSGLTVERAEFFGLNLEALESAANIDGAKTSAEGEHVRFFDKVRLYGVKADNLGDNSKLSIGGLELDQVHAQAGFLDADDEDRDFSQLSLGGIYFKDLAVAEMGDELGGVMTFRTPDFRVVGLGEGKLDAILFKDLEYDVTQNEDAVNIIGDMFGGAIGGLLDSPIGQMVSPTEERTTIGSFEWRGIDYKGLLAYRDSDVAPPTSARDLINLGNIKVTDAVSFVNGKKFSSAPLSELSHMEFVWLAPSKIRGQTKNAEYDFTVFADTGDEDILSSMKELGLDKVVANSSFSYDWDPETGEASLVTDGNASELMQFALKFDLAGLSLGSLDADAAEEGPVGLFAQTKFAGLNMSIQDEKFLDVAFTLATLESDQNAEEVRSFLPALIRVASMQYAFSNSAVADSINQLADFVEGGGGLTIEVAPEAPLTLNDFDIDDPADLVDVLGIDVTHTE